MGSPRCAFLGVARGATQIQVCESHCVRCRRPKRVVNFDSKLVLQLQHLQVLRVHRGELRQLTSVSDPACESSNCSFLVQVCVFVLELLYHAQSLDCRRQRTAKRNEQRRCRAIPIVVVGFGFLRNQLIDQLENTKTNKAPDIAVPIHDRLRTQRRAAERRFVESRDSQLLQGCRQQVQLDVHRNAQHSEMEARQILAVGAQAAQQRSRLGVERCSAPQVVEPLRGGVRFRFSTRQETNRMSMDARERKEAFQIQSSAQAARQINAEHIGARSPGRRHALTRPAAAHAPHRAGKGQRRPASSRRQSGKTDTDCCRPAALVGRDHLW